MKVIILKNYEEVSEVACEMICDQINANPKSILGLATGSSPIRTYELMVEEYDKKNITFKDIKTFNLDEYIGISCNHEQSYRTFMNNHLFNKIDINLKNTYFPETEGDLEDNVKTYNKLLAENPIDLQLLGIGSNGHIAFNEPGTSFNSITSVVELTNETRESNKRFFNSLDEVPTHAISMGIKNIMAAKNIIVIASGFNKAKALKALLEGLETEEVPATILMAHENVVLICDEAAASLLEDVEDEEDL